MCVASTIHWKHFFKKKERKWRKEDDDQGYQIEVIFIILIVSLLLIMIAAKRWLFAVLYEWKNHQSANQPASQSVKENFFVLCATSTKYKKKIPSSSIFLVSSKSNFRSTHYIGRDYIVPCYFSSALFFAFASVGCKERRKFFLLSDLQKLPLATIIADCFVDTATSRAPNKHFCSSTFQSAVIRRIDQCLWSELIT